MLHLKSISKTPAIAQATVPTKVGLTIDLIVDVLDAFKPILEAKELENQ